LRHVRVVLNLTQFLSCSGDVKEVKKLKFEVRRKRNINTKLKLLKSNGTQNELCTNDYNGRQ
jgi:hypothetical protein